MTPFFWLLIYLWACCEFYAWIELSAPDEPEGERWG